MANARRANHSAETAAPALALAALLCLFASAPPAQEPAPPAPSVPESLAPAPEPPSDEQAPPPAAEAPAGEGSEGEVETIVLPYNGMELPTAFEDFQLMGITKFSEENWGFTYQSPDPYVTFSVYLHPVPDRMKDFAAVQHIADETKGAFRLIRPDSEVLHSKSITIDRRGEKVQGKAVGFAYGRDGNGEGGELSQALFFAHKGEFYKYRITYPASAHERADPAIRRLIKRLEWPE